MTTELTDLGIAAIRDGVRDGDFSARDVAQAFIDRVAAAKPLNAFLRRYGRCGARFGRSQAIVRRADRHEGPVLHRRRADDGGERYPGGLHAHL
jgi:Asp-tRNA(Asn)/Glu-tRNA(Gln) amidotransferase A subunit family amidase